jgi:transcription termination factor Rho
LPKEGEKYFSLQKPTEVNGRDLALSRTELLLNIDTTFPSGKIQFGW